MTSTLLGSHLGRAPAIGRGGGVRATVCALHAPARPTLLRASSGPRALAPAARAPPGTSRARSGSRGTLVVTAVFERFSERSIKSVMVRAWVSMSKCLSLSRVPAPLSLTANC